MPFETITRERSRYPVRFGTRGTTAVAHYTVYATSPQMVRATLKAEVGVEVGSVYEDEQGGIPDDWCRCQEIEVSIRAGQPAGGNYALWDAVCFFAYPPGSSGDGRANPLTGEAYWWLTGDFVSKPVDHDRHGNAIQYTNYEPVEPVLTADFVAEKANVEVYLAAADQFVLFNQFRKYVRKLNSEVYHGYAAGTLRCRPFLVTPSEFTDVSGQRLYLVTGCFEFREPQKYTQGDYPAWADVVTNKGKRVFKVVNGDLVWESVKDVDGNPLSEPVLIDLEGKRQLGVGDAAVLLAWEHYDSIDFNDLGF